MIILEGVVYKLQWFRNTEVVLFLNIKDLLDKKINLGRNPFQNFFFECPGNDYDL